MHRIWLAGLVLLLASGTAGRADQWVVPGAALKPAITVIQSRTYILGPRGGCYYINRNGNRTYVDRSRCRR